MKRILKIFLLLTAPAIAFAASGPQTVINNAGLTYSTAPVQNLQNFGGPQLAAGKLSYQVTFGSVAFSNKNFTTGTQSTATVTVTSNNILPVQAINQITVPSTLQILGQAATGQFTIASNSSLGSGATAQITISGVALLTGSLTLNGAVSIKLVNGSDWLTVDTASGTAKNLATAINLWTGNTKITAAWGGGTSAIVYTTATINSTGTNNYTIVPAGAQISTTTFTNAINNAAIQVNGRTLTNGTDWTAQSTSSGTAANLATAMNTTLGITAAWGGGTSVIVYATSTITGTSGNSIAMATLAPLGISTSALTFSGGLNPQLTGDSITFNGIVGTNGIHWTDSSGTSTGTAISITAWLNTFAVIRSTTNGISSVIYSTATTAGVAGNAFTLSDTDSVLTETAPTYTGGQDAGYVTINGLRFTAGVDFSTGAATSNTATSLASAINTAILDGTSANAVGAIVTTTSTIVGTAANYALTSSTDAALTLSGPKTVTNGASTGIMTGGTNSGVTLNSSIILLPSHGFTTALPVLYTGSPAIGGLTTGTTYFPGIIDANDIALAVSSANALAGTYITITGTTTQTTANTYTLAPLAYLAGSAGGVWQASNDCLNWGTFGPTVNNIVVSSQSYTAGAPVTVIQDWGMVDFACLRYNITGPTQGAVAVKVILNAKD